MGQQNRKEYNYCPPSPQLKPMASADPWASAEPVDRPAGVSGTAHMDRPPGASCVQQRRGRL